MINISFFKKIHENIESDEEELIDMRDKGSETIGQYSNRRKSRICGSWCNYEQLWDHASC